ncbi:MAG TPA: TetR/AcrR family transcriptional regulator [Mycobacterium sp.]|nr:TetR/AcrR family transcriptional regulator [Mycobacterium sp.]
MTASSTPGLRSDAARNHQRIVTAAAAAFEEDGPAVSLDDIARRAGVGIATLYRRFGTREELIKAVAEHVFAAEIASAIVEDGADPWEDLVATLTATIDAFAAHPVLTSLAKEHAVMGMDTMAAYAAAKERVLGRARDAGMVRQDLTADDMTAVVWMALAIVHNTGRDTAVNRRYLTLLFDGLRPTGQRLPAARSESPSGSANREPRRSHKRPCSVGRPDTPRP